MKRWSENEWNLVYYAANRIVAQRSTKDEELKALVKRITRSRSAIRRMMNRAEGQIIDGLNTIASAL